MPLKMFAVHLLGEPRLIQVYEVYPHNLDHAIPGGEIRYFPPGTTLKEIQDRILDFLGWDPEDIGFFGWESLAWDLSADVDSLFPSDFGEEGARKALLVPDAN